MCLIKKYFTVVISVFIICATVFAGNSQKVISEQTIKGTKYYITYEKNNGKSSIWARKKLLTSNMNDVKLADISLKKIDVNKAMKMICRSKKTLNTGKTILGCASTVGTGLCIVTGGGGGVGAGVCVVTVGYAATGGLVDCLSGVSSAVARQIGKDAIADGIDMTVAQASIPGMVSMAIDQACQDWESKNNKKRKTH